MKRMVVRIVGSVFEGIVVCSLAGPVEAQTFLYVSHQDDDNVGVIDTSTNTLVDTIPTSSSSSANQLMAAV